MMATFDIYADMPWRKGTRLRLVSEADAPPATRQVYDGIKSALGLPVLHLYYPALGAYPEFLRLHWETVREIARSQELFDAAERLRADAYTRTHNYFRVGDLRSYTSASPDGAASELATVASYFHYRDPLVLLLFCYQMQAMEGQAGQVGVPATPRTGENAFDVVPDAVKDSITLDPLPKLLAEIRRAQEVPFVTPECCAFSRWPDFLKAYWQALKEMIASPVYDECSYGVHETAWSLASQLPGPAELTLDQMADAGLTADQVASLAKILELFVNHLSAQLLNISAAKIALEGGNLPTPRHQRPGAKDQPAA